MFISKCIKYYLKRLAKFYCIISIGLLIIAGFIYIKYKPLYKVTLNGEVIGYVESKEKMQEKIEAFANNLEGNVTSITIEEMPKYELELVSDVKESETKEDVVLATVKEQAEVICKVYAIKLDGTEKAIVNSREEAEQVVSDIKSGVNSEINVNLEIEEEEKNKKEIDNNQTTMEVAKLNINKDVQFQVQEYERKQAESRAAENRRKQQEEKQKAAQASSKKGASAPATSSGMFMRPVTNAIITSKYGQRSSGFHTGTDFATATGTPIYASAAGTVIYSGTKGSYGKLVIIDHGNGYKTYYAHCSALYVSVGQSVSKGENIAAVGTTGNSTGPHVHFEIRYNGNTLNPQNYV